MRRSSSHVKPVGGSALGRDYTCKGPEVSTGFVISRNRRAPVAKVKLGE